MLIYDEIYCISKSEKKNKNGGLSVQKLNEF